MLATLFLASLAAASPLLTRQSITTDPNADCGLQPFGYGFPSTTDTIFEENPVYAAAALIAPSPSGYTAAFRNLNGSTSQSGYMGYYLLTSYNTTTCGDYCNSASGCTAFNIFFERDRLQNPAAACMNPLPTTNIKCSLWSQDVSAGTATNEGQYREDFHVVTAGSDGFNQN